MGLLPSHCDRFCDAAGIGHIPQKQMNGHVNDYADCVEKERNSSCSSAIREEGGRSSNDGIDGTVLVEIRNILIVCVLDTNHIKFLAIFLFDAKMIRVYKDIRWW